MAQNPAVTPEPAPVRTDSLSVWPLVCEDIQEVLPRPSQHDLRSELLADMHARDDFGRAKYGTPLQVDNGRDALHDAYQEALDLCAYLRQDVERRGADADIDVTYNAALDLAIRIKGRLMARASREKGEG